MWDKPEPTLADVIAALKVVAAKVRGDESIGYKPAVRASLCVCDYGACQIPENFAADAKGRALSNSALLAYIDTVTSDAVKGPILDELRKLPWKDIVTTVLQLVSLWV